MGEKLYVTCIQKRTMTSYDNSRGIRTPLFPISGSMRRHSTFAKIHSHVCLRKSLQTCSLSSSTCRKAQRPEQHIMTRISTKDFPPPHWLHLTSVLSERHLTIITMAINKSKQRSRMTDAHLHAVLCISTKDSIRTLRNCGQAKTALQIPLQFKKASMDQVTK